MQRARTAWLIISAGVLIGVLGLWQASMAQTQGAPGAGQPPFASALDQRNEMIRELREIRTLIKEQNALLKDFVEAQRGGAKPKR